MALTAPTNRPAQPFYNIGSGLRSPLDNDNLTNEHKKTHVVKGSTFNLAVQVQQLTVLVNKLRRRILTPPNQAGNQISTFQVVSDGGDYYNCNTWNGATAGGAIIKIAKHQDIRCILPTATPAGGAWATKTIRGVTYTYTYTPTAGVTTDSVNVVEYTRGVTGSDGSSETDYITPCLNVGDIISAFQTSFTSPATLAGVTWQALADGRAWAAPKL